jgi:hypothetical protein
LEILGRAGGQSTSGQGWEIPVLPPMELVDWIVWSLFLSIEVVHFPPLRKRRAPVPYKQAYGRSKPPIAYTRPLRGDEVALTGAAKIISEWPKKKTFSTTNTMKNSSMTTTRKTPNFS